ncbi:hypothetical protein CEP52_006764 [Fusarium oligoseptatum]|uniref:Uncharacterized protein n=1 Tax=Fusarium oligoseptatum TaxID=2604345 RepID=A0A428TR73_9HYPO|nr:hypothetical protein CEP52_006764 [Fusarium oligoseptatum]
MKVFTITTTLLLTCLSLAAPSPSKEAARSISESVNTRAYLAKRGEDKTPKDEGCPGGKDFGFCVPWLGGTYCSMPGPSVGTFPMPDAECHTQYRLRFYEEPSSV